MEVKTKKGNNKQKILLSAIILLLCLSGIGVFFLVKNGGKETDKVVYSGEWDVSWYDENEKEFVITTKEQLFGLAELTQELDFKGKTVKLGADIVVNDGNAEDWKEESPDLEWKPIGSHDTPYNGTFDGQGHTISGLYMDTSDELVGFFAATDNQSQIMNFKLVNSYYSYLGDQGIGGVAGRGAGFFSQIYTDVVIDCDGWYVGGIMGFKKNNADCIIQECWYDGQINVTGRMAGGMVGQIFKGGCTISHCHNTGNIISTFPGPQAATIGGLVGTTNQRLVISDCFNAGTLINEVGRPEVGSIIGSVGGNGDVTSGLIWSTNESAPTSVGGTNQDANVKGTFFQLPEELLTGYSAYQRTDLNFDKYWAVVEDGTPMLQVFADNVPSVAGLERTMEADTSWYDVTQIESVITTPEQLKGFATLAASGEKFYGKTIKLGADIVYNKGKASKYDKDIPINIWVPINGFMGTFDGQGHTISGLYVGGAVTHVGLFALTEKQSVIKNVRIENSYFMSTDTSNSYGVGSVAGGGGGTIERVYSDAIIVSKGRYGGGIIGLFNKDGSISECWFDGEIAIEGRRSGGIVGACNNSYLKGNPVLSTLKISHCLNTGYIHRTDKKATDSATSGGIVGVINNNSTTIEDCFSAGVVTSPKYEAKGFDELGAIVSAIASGANGTVKNCFGTIESYKKIVTTIKKDSVSNINASAVLEKSMLTGYDAVSFTTLNFNKYWAVDVKGTPMLKYFAKSSPSVAGRVVPDTSWYNEKKNEFVLTTVEQLYGFSVLASGGNTFEGKTVKLGNDITVNTGAVATWQESAPQTKWNPIRSFAGTFDGQGYVISGLYGIAADDSTLGMGLFAKTAESAVVQNFKLKNTYFETNAEFGLGAVASRGNGTFKNIYTDAVLNNKKGSLSGGVLGIALKGNVTIESCWFDGQITDVGQRSGGILGYSNNQTVTIQHCLYTGSMKRVGSEVNNSVAIYGGMIGSAKGNITINDCLSDGTFESERTTSADVMGSILGETTGKGTFVLSSSYGSARSASKAVGSNGAKTDISGCMRIEEVYLQGANAGLFTMLDFNKNWTARTNNTPRLRVFTPSNEMAQITLQCDTNWYSDDKSEFVLTKKEELYGLTALSLGKNFEGKTVKLDKEITVNGGDYKTYGTTAPSYEWMPIQNFAGTFDGQKNAIKNLYGCAPKTSGLGMGLFAGTKKTANIKNLNLLDSYFETSAGYGLGAVSSRGNGTFTQIHTNATLVNHSKSGLTGGILGITLEGTATISNCWYEGSITDAGQRSGGILGYPNNQTVTVEHCLYSGSMKRSGKNMDESKSAIFGGIIGSAKGTVTVNDCLSVGTFASDRKVDGEYVDVYGTILGETTGDQKIVLTNSYGSTSSASKTVGSNGAKVDISGCMKIEDTYLQGAKACLFTMLNYQKNWVARTDNTPGLQAFTSNEEKAEVTLVCDTGWYKENDVKQYIGNKAELYGLAALSLKETFADKEIYLTKEITVNDGDYKTYGTTAPEYEWMPIQNFAGKFNGQKNAIKNLYGSAPQTSVLGMGLFAGTKESANIQELKVLDSYFETAAEYGLSAIASRGNGSFYGIHTNAILVNTSGKGLTGGVLGIALVGDVTIDNCWFEGSIIDSGYRSGGIMGYTNNQNVLVQHCLYSGSMERTGENVDTNQRGYFGGILGVAKGTVTVEDCLSIGSIESASIVQGDKDRCGTVIGKTEGNKTITFSNLYGDSSKWNRVLGQKDTNFASKTGADGCLEMRNTSFLSVAPFHKTKLDFAENWVVLKGNTTPMLKHFVTDDAKIVKLNGEITANTAWFDTAKNSGTIMTKEDLFGMIELAGNNAFNEDSVIKLGANIEAASPDVWTPIGTSSAPFKGTFDGQGYTISGLYMSRSQKDVACGLFGQIEDAVVQNFRLEDSYFENTVGAGNNALMGSVAGNGYGTLKDIYSNAILYTNGRRIGGLMGYAGSSDGSEGVNMVSCWFDGLVIIAQSNAKAVQCGGLVGYGRTVTIDTCLNTGTVRLNHKSADETYETIPLEIGGYIGTLGGKTATVDAKIVIRNCLNAATIELIWLKTDGVAQDPIGFNNYGVMTGNHKTTELTISNSYSVATVKVDLSAFGKGVKTSTKGKHSGAEENQKVEYVSGGIDVVKDDLAKENTNLPFTMEERLSLNGSTVSETALWLTREGDLPIPGSSVSAFMASKDNKGYHIKTEDDLYVFAMLVNNKGMTFQGETINLDNSLEINRVVKTETEDTIAEWKAGNVDSVRAWTPIGNSDSICFKGTFDGHGNTISGVYMSTNKVNAGLFGYICGATIQNLRVEDSYFESLIGAAKDAQLGSVLGRGYGKLESIYCNADVYSNGERIGGFVGYGGVDTNVLEMINCVYEGEVKIEEKVDASKTTKPNLQSGGLVGYAKCVTLDTCLNAGRLQVEHTSLGTTKAYSSISLNIGGLVGNVGTVNMKNTLNASTINLIWHQNTKLDESTSYFDNYGTIFGSNTAVPSNNVYSVGTVNITLSGQTTPTVSNAALMTGGVAKIKTGMNIEYAGRASELYGANADTKTGLAFSSSERTDGGTEFWKVAGDNKLPIPSTIELK